MEKTNRNKPVSKKDLETKLIIEGPFPPPHQIIDRDFEEWEFNGTQVFETHRMGRFSKASVPVDLIKSNKAQPMSRTEWNKIKPLTKSFDISGQNTPIILKRLGDESFMLKDGQRRLNAAKRRGQTCIYANIDYKATNILQDFMNINDPSVNMRMSNKQFLEVYFNIGDSNVKLPNGVHHKILIVKESLGKPFLKEMLDDNISLSFVKAAIEIKNIIGLKNRDQLKKFIRWALRHKAVMTIKSFKNLTDNEKETGKTAQMLIKAFRKNAPVRLEVGE